MSLIDIIIEYVIKREGSEKYVNHPQDKGGPTKFGITQKTLSEFLGKPVSEDDVKALSKSTAIDIYRMVYVVKPGFDKIKSEILLELVVDSAVHSGVAASVNWLQEALNVVVDGKFGPRTLDAANSCNTVETVRKMAKIRIKFIGRIVSNNPRQLVFLNGWLSRCLEFL